MLIGTVEYSGSQSRKVYYQMPVRFGQPFIHKTNKSGNGIRRMPCLRLDRSWNLGDHLLVFEARYPQRERAACLDPVA